jgi:hypothetical protein
MVRSCSARHALSARTCHSCVLPTVRPLGRYCARCAGLPRTLGCGAKLAPWRGEALSLIISLSCVEGTKPAVVRHWITGECQQRICGRGLEGTQSDRGVAFQLFVIGSSFPRMLALEFVVVCRPQSVIERPLITISRACKRQTEIPPFGN